MKKIFKKIACLLLVLTMLTSIIACNVGKDGVEGENGYLKISAVKLGYGVDWLYAIEKEFENDTGINVDISVKTGQSGVAALNSEIESLASKTDLFFNKRGFFSKDVYQGSIKAKGKAYDALYADLSDVWASVADVGSDKTIAEKINSAYNSAFKIEGKYYALPWAGGLFGLVRNIDVWNTLDLQESDVPYTTNQLFEISDKVVSKGVSPFIYSLESEYYTGWLNLFFSQYEGKENVENFLNGYDPDGEVTEYIFTYPGHEEALKVIQKLLNTPNYQNEMSTAIDFTSMQGLFLKGQALFNINGSWLDSESAANFKEAEVDMIKTPIISSIVNKLSFSPTVNGVKIKYDNLTAEQKKVADEKLVEIIKYVDAINSNQTASKPVGVTDADVKIVTEARSYSFINGGSDHQAFVPSYSSHVREAKEFLKYMYSDKGMNIYYNALNGTQLPAKISTQYTSNLTLTTFRKSANANADEGYILNRDSNSRFFAIVATTPSNGVNIVNALRTGKTPNEIIDLNTNAIKTKWSSITPLLKK